MTTKRHCSQCGAPIPVASPGALCPACHPTQAGPGDDGEEARQGQLPAGALFGDHRIVRFLGEGGMGRVYEAHDTVSQRRVALKILKKNVEPVDRKRFLREGRTAARVNHPNCIYLYGAHEIEGVFAISMELAAQPTLQERIDVGGPLPVVAAVDTVLQVIAGLEAAAAVGLLHRDVKPANCMVDAAGVVKVGDFGLSIPTLAEERTTITRDGVFAGTPAFASPEQLLVKDLDVRSDIYSVGATLFYLLTGKPPFEARNPGQLLAKILQEPVDTTPLAERDVPAALRAEIVRCLAKDPAHRPVDYGSLRRALRRYGSSAAPRPAPPPLRIRAALIDTLFAGILPWALFQGVHFGSTRFLDQTSPYLLALAGGATYFLLTEAIWRASVGKMLVGLRIVGPQGTEPSLARIVARTSVLVGATLVGGVVGEIVWRLWLFSIGAYPVPAVAQLPFLFAATLAWYALPVMVVFAPARPANDFAGVHGLVSRTRVVWQGRTSSQLSPGGLEPHPPLTGERIGPYEVLEELGKAGSRKLFLAFDPILRRALWVCVRGDEAPPLPTARRELSRLTRLRWVNGARGPNETWDAYEYEAGSSLRQLQDAASDWGRVRGWLTDLSDELREGMRDGTLPREIGESHLWVSRRGTAMILDFPLPRDAGSSDEETVPPADVERFQPFLAQIGNRALEARDGDGTAGAAPRAHPPHTLPLHGHRILDKLARSSFASYAALAEHLHEVEDWDAVISPWTRLGHISIQALLPAGFFAGAVVALLRSGTAALLFIPGMLLWAVNAAFMVALFGVAFAHLFRGGLLLRWLRMRVITSDGREASRTRALARALVAWSPVCLAVTAIVLADYFRDDRLIWLSAFPLLILALGAAFSVIHPSRGLHDLAAGTFLVAR